MLEDLYDRDFYAWTQSQASALRSRRSGENAIDYDPLAEALGDLIAEELIGGDAVMQARLGGYGWAEIVDRDWFAEHRVG